MGYWIAGGVVLVLLFAWSLCRAAGDADRRVEREMAEESFKRRQQGTVTPPP